MKHFTAPNQPKINDRNGGSIPRDTIPISIVDFRRFRAGRMLHLIFRQLLCILLCACHFSAPSKPDPCTHFGGWSMTMPYHIIIGKELSPSETEEISLTIAETFRDLDQTFNQQNPASEISRVNQAVSSTVSDSLSQLILFCDGIVKLSAGRFDPTVEPLERLWKESFQANQPPSIEQQRTVAQAVGWEKVSLQKNIFSKTHPQTRIDLSAAAKGLCVDWITERLQAKGYKDLFVEWAGKIRASGRHPTKGAWQVQVDPGFRISGRPIAPIPIHDAAIATIADCKEKNWHLQLTDGKEHYFSHIIDPIEGKPLEKTESSIASVSVIAPTCELANALATAAMVFPNRKEALRWAQEVVELYPQVSFWILAYDIKNAQ
jgi:FAD:protein FMN transferase